MEILLANPRGFCAGVDRAIEIVERALESFGAPIYVCHEVVLIGHAGHPEVEGTLGQWVAADATGQIHLVETPDDVAHLTPKNPEKIAYVTQTTLSVDDTKAVIEALRAKFPAVAGPRHDDICYATQNRQDAVRKLGQQCDLVLVVGSPNSSNSNRLRELAQKQGVPAHLI